jgi:putative transposase
MEIRRTVPVKLDVSDSAAESLFATFEEFRFAANCVVARARRDDGLVETSKQRLHERTYDEVRARTGDLHANLVQAARSRAADALKAVVERWKDGEYASMPTFTADFADYDTRSATFHGDWASLATPDGRVEVEYVLPPNTDNTPFGEYVASGDYEVNGASLHHRNNSFYLHLRAKTEVDDIDPAEHPTVLGVDLGIENLAVTSTARFWSGGLLNHCRDAYERLCGSLQQTGTESAHWTIKDIGQRHSRWSKDLLHNVAKELVAEALAYDCSIIAFEDLADIRERISNASKFQQWAFNKLYEYVEYKAEAVGISVTQVPPQNTSRRCSACGYTAKNNRPNGDDEFCCQECGYELHADYNVLESEALQWSGNLRFPSTAKNIAWKHVRAGQKSRRGRANRQLALKSGTVNGNGEFTPADAVSARAGVHR